MAQDYSRENNISVLERERPTYDPVGLRAGGFTLYPQLAAGADYTTNVFKTDTDEEADAFLIFDPSVRAVSNWGRHRLEGQAGLHTRRYIEQDSEDETGWYLRALGRLEIHGQSYLTGAADVQQLYLRREDSDFPTAATEPVPYISSGVNLRGVHEFGRIRMGVGLRLRHNRFEDVDALAGLRLDMSGRDIDSVGAELKAEYAFAPGRAAFVRGEVVENDYRHDEPLYGPVRDSTDQSILAGANFDLTALMRGEVGVGYLSREYDSPTFDDISGLAVAGTVEYFPTPLTTLTFSVHRRVEDSYLPNSGGYVSSGGGVRIDHELLRNLLLKLEAQVVEEAYEDIDRTDEETRFTAGARWLVSRSVWLEGAATWLSLDSSGAARRRSFDDLRLMLTLILQR